MKGKRKTKRWYAGLSSIIMIPLSLGLSLLSADLQQTLKPYTLFVHILLAVCCLLYIWFAVLQYRQENTGSGKQRQVKPTGSVVARDVIVDHGGTVSDCQNAIQNGAKADGDMAGRDIYKGVVNIFYQTSPPSGTQMMSYVAQCREITETNLSYVVADIPIVGHIVLPDAERVLDMLQGGGSVVLHGEAGVGKSGIAKEVADTALKEDSAVLYLRVDQTHGVLQEWRDVVHMLPQQQTCLIILDQADNLTQEQMAEVLQLAGSGDRAKARVLLVVREYTFEHQSLIKRLGFQEYRVQQLEVDDVQQYLATMGIPTASSELLGLCQNVLNLGIVGDIVSMRGTVNDVTTDGALWDRFRQLIEEVDGDRALACVVEKACECAREGKLELVRPLPRETPFTSLESRRILIPTANPECVRFRHAKMRDFLVAWKIVARTTHRKDRLEQTMAVNITVRRNVMEWAGKIAASMNLEEEMLEVFWDVR